MTDAIKLSVRLRDILWKYKWRAPFRFNAGYFSFAMECYDLDFIEYYLSLPDIREMPWLSEQTCWALLFGRAGGGCTPDPEQFICRENYAGPDEKALAIHLIAKLKPFFNDWAVALDQIAPINGDLRFRPGRNVSVCDFAAKVFLRNVLRRNY